MISVFALNVNVPAKHPAYSQCHHWNRRASRKHIEDYGHLVGVVPAFIVGVFEGFFGSDANMDDGVGVGFDDSCFASPGRARFENVIVDFDFW